MNVNSSSEKIDEALSVIFQKEDLLTSFMQIDDIDEMYEFCISVRGGYTNKEFCDYLEKFADLMEEEAKKRGENGLLSEIPEEEIEYIAGGISNLKKWISGGLAAVSLLSSSGINAHAAENDKVDSKIKDAVEAVKKEKEDQDKTPLNEKIKEKLSSAGKFLWRHKGKIALGTAVVLAAAAGISAIGYGIAHEVRENKKDREAGAKDVDKGKLREQIRDNKVAASIAEKAKDEAMQEIKKTRNEAIEAAKKNKNLSKEKLDEALKAADNAYSQAMDKINQDYNPRMISLRGEVDRLTKEKKDASWTGTISNKLQGKGAVVSGLGSIAIAGVSGFTWLYKNVLPKLKEWGQATKDIKNIFGFTQTIGNIVSAAKNGAETAARKSKSSRYDPERRRKQLIKDLEQIKGQEEAKQSAISYFDAIIAKRKMSKGTGKNKPNIIVLNGSAGIGKTMCAQALAKALSPVEPYETSAPAQVNLEKGNLAEQLFKVGEYAIWNPFEKKTASLGTFIKECPMGVGIINEYDKVYVPGRVHPLDEIFRKILDDGEVPNGDNEPIDASNFTFILTTNETTKSLKPNEPLTPQDILDNQDNTRTVVIHDGSFLTRLRVVSLHLLTEKDCKEIAEQEIEPCIKFLGSRKGGSLKIDVSKDFYDKIAAYVVTQHQGARPIGRLSEDLIGEIITKTVNTVEGKKKNPKLTFSVDFNERTGKFDVKITSKHTLLTPEKIINSDPQTRYKEMAENMFESYFKVLALEQNGGLKFKYDNNDMYGKIGKYIDKQNRDSSEILEALSQKFMAELVNKMIEMGVGEQVAPGLEFSLDFNEETGEFIVNLLSPIETPEKK